MTQTILKIYDPEAATDRHFSNHSNHHKILIVDDEELLTTSLRETLLSEGYQVTAAVDPLEAMKLLREDSFSLVMSDQRMPQMTGLEFLAQAKQLQPDATRILITGVVNLNTVIEAINKGEIYRFIVKPWIKEELLVAVSNAVQRYELIRRNRDLQSSTLRMNEQLAALNQSLQEKIQDEAVHCSELAELNKALETNLHRSVEISFRMMQSFYPSLGVQAEKVHSLCRSLGECLQLSPKDMQILEISAWLHDIGLVGTPRRLIKLWQKRPESLSQAELDLIQQHPILGQELAAFIHHLHDVGEVIRAHHEHYDGSGYPDRKEGDAIPFLGRILGVAVAYVSSPAPEAAAFETISCENGKKFDPEAVRALGQCQNRLRLPRVEKGILLKELEPGMVLAEEIYGPNGVLLMPEGQKLNEPLITKLKNHDRVHPLKQSLLVYC